MDEFGRTVQAKVPSTASMPRSSRMVPPSASSSVQREQAGPEARSEASQENVTQDMLNKVVSCVVNM